MTLFLGLMVPVVTSAASSDSPESASTSIVVSLPAIQPDASSACAAEAAQYAAAIVDLNRARKAASEAYQQWYDCEYENGYGGKSTPPVVEIPSAELSVLVKD